MLNYDIDQDLLEQQKKYLQYLLAVTALGCIAVFL